jgi:hypothetical protein
MLFSITALSALVLAAEPEEALLHLKDVETGKPVLAHSGTVYWNDYRRRWVMIAVVIRHVLSGRGLVCRGGPPAWPVGLRQKGRHA